MLEVEDRLDEEFTLRTIFEHADLEPYDVIVLWLRIGRGKTFPEIGELVDLSHEAARQQYLRAVEKLQRARRRMQDPLYCARNGLPQPR